MRELWLAEDLDESPVVAEIVDLAGDRRVNTVRIGRGALDAEARSQAPQGVIAWASPVTPVELADLFEADRGIPFLLAVDGVSDPGNLGALLRTAECAGVTGVMMPRHRAARLGPSAVKAAAGAVEHLRFAQVPGIPAALASCRDAGLWTVGLDPGGARSVHDLAVVASSPIVIVVGSEGRGLSRLTAERCDELVSVPQAGHVESLNVSVAGAVALYEVVRARGNSLSQPPE